MSGSIIPGPAVLAVDGGNSKTDVAFVGRDGRLLAAVRGPTISHQVIGVERGAQRLAELADIAWARTGSPGPRPPSTVGAYTLAGADTPADVRRMRRAFGAHDLARETTIVNDAFAPIRAGSEQGWGVGVICGAGIGAAGMGPDGRTARLTALGAISGDWGGGRDVGMAALGAAVRARDGRGPRTTLETAVPSQFGLSRPLDVTFAIEYGRLPEDQLRELSPVVFAAATSGDVVARAILDRLADELATMAIAIIRRLHVTRREVDVTLAGGVFRAADPIFEARIADAIAAVAPRACTRRLDAPPVLGAALFGLDRLPDLTKDERPRAVERIRAQLTDEPDPAIA